MRRITTLVLVSLMLTIPVLAHASQVCWRLQDGLGNPLLDFLRCSAIFAPPSMFVLNCSDEADPLYHAVGAGTATQDVEVDFTKFRMGLSLTHTAPGFFADNRVGSFTAFLTADENAPDYLDGTWTMQWSGGPGAPFNVSGLIEFFACPANLAQAQNNVSAQQMNRVSEPQAAGLGNFVTLEK